jgi:glyoxylase-like metal-dependent hydrolase (beta-lactamase superfamily II)
LKIVKLSNFLTAIHFPPKEGNSNPFTSYLYQKGASTILIDSCAFHNSYDLHKFLQASSLNPDAIIFSHYHGDHIGGYSSLPEIAIRVGSSRYNEMLCLYSKLDNPEKYIPTHLVSDGIFSLKIGSIDLKLFQTPGHSPCSISTIIDAEYLHIGDILINSEAGEPLLPLAYFELITEHLKSLDIIEDYIDMTWLSGHGTLTQNTAYKKNLLSDQKKYFGRIQAASGDIDYATATKDLIYMYKHAFWHERNLVDED